MPEAFREGGFAKQAALRQATTAGMTTEEFVTSQLPGFEERFRDSPFYQAELERGEQEAERRERSAEAERRSRLRRGTGTRGTFSLFGRRTE